MDFDFLPKELLYDEEILNTSYGKLKKRNQLIKNLVNELEKVGEEDRTERVSKRSKRTIQIVKKDDRGDQSFMEKVSSALGCFMKK